MLASDCLQLTIARYFLLLYFIVGYCKVSAFTTMYPALFRTICSRSPAVTLTRRQLTTNIIVVGKRNGGEQWISEGYSEYEKRLKPIMNLQTTFLKSDEELIRASQTSKGCIIALDERGKQHTSVEFTDLFYSSIEKGGSHVTFIIGGFAGLPDEIRNNYSLISLSKLTWTHTMARLLLVEQIYRATEIGKGSGYHKD